MTWADILGQQFDEHQNWGQAGGGNGFIFNAFCEADQRERFGDGDTVVVCWTNIMREDRYIGSRGGWITVGNIMTATQIYSKEFLADSVCERGCLIRDLAYIKSVKDILAGRPNVTWRFLSMCPILRVDPWSEKMLQFQDVIDLYQDVIDSIPASFLEVLGDGYWERDLDERFYHEGGNPDYHPTSREHLRYLDSVLPGWVQDQSIRDRVAQNPVIWNKMSDGSCKQIRL